MYPGVSKYGMEADPPRFLYLKDEDHKISEEVGIEQRKI